MNYWCEVWPDIDEKPTEGTLFVGTVEHVGNELVDVSILGVLADGEFEFPPQIKCFDWNLNTEVAEALSGSVSLLRVREDGQLDILEEICEDRSFSSTYLEVRSFCSAFEMASRSKEDASLDEVLEAVRATRDEYKNEILTAVRRLFGQKHPPVRTSFLDEPRAAQLKLLGDAAAGGEDATEAARKIFTITENQHPSAFESRMAIPDDYTNELKTFRNEILRKGYR